MRCWLLALLGQLSFCRSFSKTPLQTRHDDKRYAGPLLLGFKLTET